MAMNDQKPAGSADNQPPSRHWYNPAAEFDVTGGSARSARSGSARERLRRRREAQRIDMSLPRPSWSWAVILGAVVGIIGIIALIAIVSSASEGAAQPSAAKPPPQSLAALTPAALGPAASAATLPGAYSIAQIPQWNGKDRVNILLMGLDKRPGEIGTGFRTDTLILLSLNPSTKTIGMLSIPRDLHVAIPDQTTLQPINTIYVQGELLRPGGGPKYTAQIVQYNFGIPIHYPIAVSFDAVIELVNAVGGVEIDVLQAINDPEYPDMQNGYEPLVIPQGKIKMDGALALKYARTRHQSSDFDRTYRQQQLLLAIRQQALKPEKLPQLVGSAPAIWNAISKNVVTDMSFDQLISLAWAAKDIPLQSIKRGTVDEGYVRATAYNGISVLLPDRAKLPELMERVFGADYNR
jgi:LCP family protein required for cell wall assembly